MSDSIVGHVEACVVTQYVTEAERDAFLSAWGIKAMPPWLLMQHDVNRDGCGVTKNRGVLRAISEGADIVVVLDGDCYPSDEAPTLEDLMVKHAAALQPQPVDLYAVVTNPPSRGTPYGDLNVMLPVAASMGFWTDVPDYCAVRQLAFACRPMDFTRETISGRYFPLCGMNIAFRPVDWWPWHQFIDVSRFDDIWMGWLWQREAYRRGYCFNLNGPLIRHARQSNVWRNLIDEAAWLKETETLWQQIAQHPTGAYEDLLKLLPTGTTELKTGGVMFLNDVKRARAAAGQAGQ